MAARDGALLFACQRSSPPTLQTSRLFLLAVRVEEGQAWLPDPGGVGARVGGAGGYVE